MKPDDRFSIQVSDDYMEFYSWALPIYGAGNEHLYMLWTGWQAKCKQLKSEKTKKKNK